MKLLKIGDDYYNLEEVIKIKTKDDESFSLIFPENVEAIVTKENRENFLQIIENSIVGSISAPERKEYEQESYSDGTVQFD